uniref:E3 ubiquitin-protein ligase listerin n=1 Tax=Angiostrongylus cantonensis TaxID=6313 RepID=A0A158PCB1_ANGCA
MLNTSPCWYKSRLCNRMEFECISREIRFDLHKVSICYLSSHLMSKPQRRKGNAKRTGRSTGFVGFDSGSSNVFEVAAAAKEGVIFRELDQDIVLILRKLSKKDHQTREKGLRELLSCLKEKGQEMIETCYNHYVAIVDKLVLDGSPTVRLLALRMVSFFISSLKKAAEKQLKFVIPFVLIGACDVSLSVANQAESVLSENFPGDKSTQVISIFALNTVTVAVEIIAGRHTLVQAQKYDSADSPEQRQTRLKTQCLLAIARVAPTASSNAKLKESLENFFKDTVAMKALLKSNSSVKSALLGICIKMADCVPILLSTQLPTWIISNLDSGEASLSTRAFEALILLVSDERFHEKFDINKVVIPKLLSVVRKKGVHWSYVSQFLLPCYALLTSHVAEKSKFVQSFLESFMDNLPFEAEGRMQSWMNSFIECVKYSLSNEELLDNLAYPKLIDLVVRSMEVLQEESSEIQKGFVALLHWILEKDALPMEHMTFLLDSLQLAIVGKLAECGEVLSPILEKPLCLPFIVELLNSLELPNDLSADLSRLVFLSLFRDVKDDEIDLAVSLVARFPPCELVIRNLVSSLVDLPCTENLPTNYSFESLNRAGMICSQLLYADNRFVALLPSHDDLLSMLTTVDTWVSIDVIAQCGLFPDPLFNKTEDQHSESEQLRFVHTCAQRALIYLSIDCEDPAHDVSLAYAGAVAPIVRMLYNTQWRCQPMTNSLTDMVHQWDRVFQSCDERKETQSENSVPLESLAGSALMLFNKFAEIATYQFNNSFDTEWPNFFLPTLSRIVVRWYSLLKPDSKPSFFVRNLVDAVHHIHALPNDLLLKKQLCPELDKLGYDDIHQTLIVHTEDLLLSENSFIRFAALHMLKILSPIMYKQENGQWMEEDKVSSTGPRHVVVPETLARLITGATGWPAACIISDEERVAYCDALLHPVSIVLQQVLARCPEDIRKLCSLFLR